MSFISDLFGGNFSNLGNDLFGSPTAIAETLGAVALPFAAFAAPALLGGSAAADVGAAGAAGAADLGTLGGAGAAGIGAGLDTTAGAGLATAADVSGAAAPLAFADTTAAANPADFTGLFMSAQPGAVTAPGVTGVDAGASVGAGIGGLGDTTVAPSLGQAAGIADSSGFLSTPIGSDAAFTGGDFAATGGVGAVPPSTAATGAAGTPSVFGPAPTAFDMGAPATAFPGATGGAVPAGAAAPGGPGFLSTVGSTLKDIAPVAGVAGLAANLYSGYQQQQQLKALQATETNYQNTIAQAAQTAIKAAQPLLTSGTALTNYLSTGTLPQGLQDVVQQQIASAKAARIQAASNMGQSTNPQMNTALAQDLAAIERQGTMLTTQLEQQLATSGQQMLQTANQMISNGISGTEVAAQLPMMVQNLNIKLAQMTSNSLMSFAAALNGGSQRPFQFSINPSTGAVSPGSVILYTMDMIIQIIIWLIIAGFIYWAAKMIIDLMPIDAWFKQIIQVLLFILVAAIVLFKVLIPVLQTVAHMGSGAFHF